MLDIKGDHYHSLRTISPLIVIFFAIALLFACEAKTEQQNTQALLQDAQLAYSANDLDSAKGYYLRILNSDNNHIVAHKQLMKLPKS